MRGEHHDVSGLDHVDLLAQVPRRSGSTVGEGDQLEDQLPRRVDTHDLRPELLGHAAPAGVQRELPGHGQEELEEEKKPEEHEGRGEGPKAGAEPDHGTRGHADPRFQASCLRTTPINVRAALK
jgi:hypothetical protein